MGADCCGESAAFWDSLSRGEERHFQQEPPLYPVTAILIMPFCTPLSLSVCRSQNAFQTGLKSQSPLGN